MEITTTMTSRVAITISHETRTLEVGAHECGGRINIPAGIDLTNWVALSALAIVALTPMARKIIAHEPWFAEVVADPLVREFVERAHATYADKPDATAQRVLRPDVEMTLHADGSIVTVVCGSTFDGRLSADRPDDIPSDNAVELAGLVSLLPLIAKVATADQIDREALDQLNRTVAYAEADHVE